jgi:hypothetical protein
MRLVALVFLSKKVVDLFWDFGGGRENLLACDSVLGLSGYGLAELDKQLRV